MLEERKVLGAAEAGEVKPLLDLAKSVYDDRLSPAEWQAAHRGVQRWASRSRQPRRRGGVFALAGCLAVAAAVMVWLQRDRTAAPTIAEVDVPLTFQVQGGAVAEGGYLSANGRGPVTAAFSDGTRVTFEGGARGRVLGTTPRGGRLSLEQGQAHVHIRRLPAAAWVVNAGPYAVEVTGTEFLVAWSPNQEELELRLRKGSVTVRGPFATSGIAMTAGQRLRIALAESRVTLEQDQSETSAPAEEPPARVHAGGREASRAPHAAFKRPPVAQTPAASWGDQVASGNFAAVVEAAEQRGLARTLKRGTLAEISALADAARYARKADIAKAALQAQQKRFPGAAASREATFFLARLAEDDNRWEQASALYDRYLGGNGQGLYAGEALGRKMMLEQKQGHASAARALAEEYLQQHPHGSYTTPARKLVGVR